MKNLSGEEINKKGQSYDNLHNEGGDGFNPYWEEIERRNLEAARVRAALPKSKNEQIDAFHERIRKECGSVARDCGIAGIDEKQSRFYAEIDHLKKEIEEEFKAEWTEVVTAARREEWNDFIRSIMNVKGQIDGQNQPKIYQRQIDQGWKTDDLKKAVAIYKK